MSGIPRQPQPLQQPANILIAPQIAQQNFAAPHPVPPRLPAHIQQHNILPDGTRRVPKPPQRLNI